MDFDSLSQYRNMSIITEIIYDSVTADAETLIVLIINYLFYFILFILVNSSKI